RGPSTLSGRARADATRSERDRLVCWKYWWELNRDALLEHAARDATAVRTIGGEPAFDAHGDAGGAPWRAARLAPLVQSLRKAMAEEDLQVAGSAALALGRVVERGDTALARQELLAMLGRREVALREQAVLALGALGSAEALAPL